MQGQASILAVWCKLLTWEVLVVLVGQRAGALFSTTDELWWVNKWAEDCIRSLNICCNKLAEVLG